MMLGCKPMEVTTLIEDANKNKPIVKSADVDIIKPNEQEIAVFRLMRNMEYGEIRIVMKDSKVVQIEEKKSIRL